LWLPDWKRGLKREMAEGVNEKPGGQGSSKRKGSGGKVARVPYKERNVEKTLRRFRQGTTGSRQANALLNYKKRGSSFPHNEGFIRYPGAGLRRGEPTRRKRGGLSTRKAVKGHSL